MGPSVKIALADDISQNINFIWQEEAGASESGANGAADNVQEPAAELPVSASASIIPTTACICYTTARWQLLWSAALYKFTAQSVASKCSFKNETLFKKKHYS